MICQQIGQPEEMDKFIEIENFPKLKQKERIFEQTDLPAIKLN